MKILGSVVLLMAPLLIAVGCGGATPSSQGRIAFVSDRSGDHEIWVMNADGSDQRQLTHMPPLNYSPSWSPDGRQIAFVSTAGRNENQDIYVMNADGSNLRQLTDTPESEYRPRWSPDGRRIAFACDGRMCIMNADGSERRRLDIRGSNPSFATWMDSWSPDGRQIAYSEGAMASFTTFSQVYIADADGKNRRKLVEGVDYAAEPAWSPSGNQIVFVCAEKQAFDFPGQTPDPDPGFVGICLVNADGSRLRQVIEGGSSPTWSPDGEWIAFGLDEDIYIARPDGTSVGKLTNYPGQDRAPAWSPAR